MKYDMVIFDLDGTILNTLPDLCASVNYALSYYNFPQRTLEEIRKFIGNGVGMLIKRSLPVNTDNETYNSCLNRFLENYKKNYAVSTKPYNGIYDAIRIIKKSGYTICVVSNKFDSAVKALCAKFFPGLIDLAIGETEGIPRKPAPDSVNNVIKQFNIDKKRILYIGDSDVDVKTAQNANLDFLGVSWGFKGKELLLSYGATKIIDSPEEIISALKI